MEQSLICFSPAFEKTPEKDVNEAGGSASITGDTSKDNRITKITDFLEWLKDLGPNLETIIKSWTEQNLLFKECVSKIESLEANYASSKNENTELREKLGKMTKKLSFTTKELAIKEKQRLEKEITEAADSHSKAMSNLKMEKAILQEEREKLSAKLEEAEKETLTYKIINAELAEKLSFLTEENSSFKKTHDKIVQALQDAGEKIKLLHSSEVESQNQANKKKRSLSEVSEEELDKENSDREAIKGSEEESNKPVNKKNAVAKNTSVKKPKVSTVRTSRR